MDIAAKHIALLAKLMNDEAKQSTKAEQLFDDLYKEINKDFADVLASSIIPNKSRLLTELNKIIETIEILVLYPELLGKTIIGVMGSNAGIYKNLIPRIVSAATVQSMKINTNIPNVCLRNSPYEISALNVLGKEIELTQPDYYEVNRQLYKYKIDIRDMINSFSVSADIVFDNFSLIHFPDHTHKFKKFNSALVEKVDAFFIYVAREDKRSFQNLNFLCNYSSTPVFIIVDGDYAEEFKKIHSKMRNNILVITDEQIDGILEALNSFRVNFSLVDEIRLCLLEVDRFYKFYLKKLSSRLANINADLVKIDHGETNEKAKNIRNGLRQTIESSDNYYYQIRAKTDLLVRKAIALEELFENTLNVNDSQLTNLYRGNITDVWSKLVLRFIDTEDYRMAKEYVGKLKRINFAYTYILELLISQGKNELLSTKDLAQLAKEDEDFLLVQQAKIVLGEQLGFSSNDFIRVAALINYPSSPLEYYYKARGLEKSKPEQAIRLYFQALEFGHTLSGERLYELSKTISTISVERLAQNMVPIANYELGMKIKEKQYAKGITNLKIAATYGYLPAIKVLAEDYYGKVISSYYKNLSEEEMKKKYDDVFELHQYILSREPNNIDAIEKMGHLFYKLEDYRRALDYLKRCETPFALFRCGNIYQYGKGTAQDLQKAKEYLEQAWQKGHPKAKIEYDKVNSWIEKNAYQRSSYSSQRNYSSRSSYSGGSSSSSDSFCFITTATCFALNKEDNCSELLLMKKYRDFMKERDENVDCLIKEYYRIAPSIVKLIDQEEDSRDIYLSLWEKYISKTYNCILNQEFEEATVTYIRMVKSLCDKFGFALSKDASQRILLYLK